MEQLLKAERPDLVHLQNIHHHLSPSVITAARKQIPIQQEEARGIIHRAVSMNYGDRQLRDLALPYLELPGSGLEARR